MSPSAGTWQAVTVFSANVISIILGSLSSQVDEAMGASQGPLPHFGQETIYRLILDTLISCSELFSLVSSELRVNNSLITVISG